MSETGDIDTLAAEYVLGTLDADERTHAQALLAVDHALAAKVRIWERRLSELHLMVEPIEPEDEIWDRIRRTIPRPEPQPPPTPVAVPVPAPAAAAITPPAIASAAAAVAAPSWLVVEPAPAPPKIAPAPAFTPSTAFAPLTGSPPAAADDQPARPKERPSLESLEEAVLRAADDLQRRATAETVVEPVVEPVAEPVVEPAEMSPAVTTPEEADGKAREEAGSTLEEAAKSTEETPKTEETPAPAVAAVEEPAPSGVLDDMPEPTPAGPLAAFPTPFTAPASIPTPAPVVPAPSATLTVPPPVAPPSAAVAVRQSERRAPPPAPRSRWLARTVATLATLILLMVAALVAAWRFVPERVPQQLRPVELLRAAGIAVPTVVVGPPPRKPAPPESQYEE